MKNYRSLIPVVLGLCAFMVVGCNAQRWANEATETTYQETRPLALLAKYRKFKSMAAQLDAKQANILASVASLEETKRTYGTDALKWPRDVREEMAQTRTELNDMKLAFNGLAADYNTAMADYTTRFCNVGKMPAGFPDTDQQALKPNYATYMVH